MNIKKILLGSLITGGALALIRLAIASGTASKPPRKVTSYTTIDDYVKEQCRRLKIPGASMAIIAGNKIVHYYGYGQTRPGGEPPSPQTPFFIGSLTKSFTALAVVQLIEAGKIELDAPVQRYLPWFRVSDPRASASMTVRHLLNQTSGLSTGAGSIILTDLDDSPGANERQIRSLSRLKLNNPVGVKCEYSNLNYNILGLIVEIVSGETYAKYINKHILNPLEMTHSYTSKEDAKQNGLAMGYRHWFSLPFPASNLQIPQGSLPSGQLISSAEDMAHYLIAHLNGGHYGEVQILSAEGIEEMHRGAVDFIMMGVSSGRYGMGWFDIDLGQTKTYSHSGNVPDFSAFMALLPEQGKGVILLFNADPYGLPPITEEVGMGLTALLAGRQPDSIKLGFIPWIMRLLPLIPILQVVDVITTLRRLHKWDQNPQSCPRRGSLWSRHILLPLLPNLSLAGSLGYLLISRLFGFIQLFMPDVAVITMICGGFAGIWALLRTGLMLRALRK
jgi:CubicO group peptidase (beta-lactamase class C family)